MMIDTLKYEKEFLEEYLKIITRINNFYIKDKGFILKDLLDDEVISSQYDIYMTKGILQSLIYFGYIEIFSLYNGKTGFVYRAKKKIGEKVK